MQRNNRVSVRIINPNSEEDTVRCLQDVIRSAAERSQHANSGILQSVDRQ